MSGILEVMKTCAACGISKPPNEFYRHKESGDGLQRSCKGCQRDQRRNSRRVAAEATKPETPVDLPGEQWRPVVAYEGLYSVSNLGRVQSEGRVVERIDGTTCRVHARILTAVPDPKGYLRVNLFRDNRGITAYIHQLVLSAFVGNQTEGLVVRHLNGNKADNLLENLRYGTASENMRDAIRHGTHRNTYKTECPSGHEYTVENTAYYGDRKARYCKACRSGGRTNPAWTRR